jgi:hypothetical protein
MDNKQGSGDVVPIFVFGSNLAGRHGAGSAKHAMLHHGARYGVGVGFCGTSYAIPTKDANLRVMPINAIKPHIDTFVEFARQNPSMTFEIVKVGCGLAGYTDSQVAPLFKGLPSNCRVHPDWLQYL